MTSRISSTLCGVAKDVGDAAAGLSMGAKRAQRRSQNKNDYPENSACPSSGILMQDSNEQTDIGSRANVDTLISALLARVAHLEERESAMDAWKLSTVQQLTEIEQE